MTIIDTAKVTSKGQVTIPNHIRRLLAVQQGSSIAFGLSKEGIVLLPCKVTLDNPYTAQEWGKIEKLALSRGKTYKTAKEAKKHIEAL